MIMEVTTKQPVIINFDMDGVLAKWNPNASEEEVMLPGYFLNREVEERAVELVKRCKENRMLQPRILSSVYPEERYRIEKKIWLEKAGLGDIPHIFVPYGEDKFQYVEKDTFQILVDDFGKNLVAWEAAGYTAIKFYNGINDRPRIEFDMNGSAQLKADSWVGPSIDYRMETIDMLAVILGQISVKYLNSTPSIAA